jgi:hypothetical protein
VVHQGQGLPFGLKPGQHLLGVHAGLDDLERDRPAHRIGLFGHPHAAHAAFAKPLEKLIAADPLARLMVANGRRAGILVVDAEEKPRLKSNARPIVIVIEFGILWPLNNLLWSDPTPDPKQLTLVRPHARCDPTPAMGPAGSRSVKRKELLPLRLVRLAAVLADLEGFGEAELFRALFRVVLAKRGAESVGGC